MREEAEAIEVWSPSFPRSLKTVWQGHNEQSIGQIRLRYPKPIAEILSNTHGVERPSAGEVVSNPALESALPTRVNFTQKEWAAFGIAHLQFDDYIMADFFHTNTDRALPFQFARLQEWRPSRADPPLWQPLRGRLKRPESHLFVFFRCFWFTGPLFKFASSWLKIVGNVINVRHNVVVKLQVCDAKSSPFLLREIHFGGQGAFQCWVRHHLTCWRPFDTNASPFPTK